MMSELDMLKRELEDLREQVAKHKPQIRGFFTLESFRDDGKLVQRSQGENILTLTGREFYSELAVLQAFSGPNMFFRNDRLAYFGLGIGAQPEIPNITSLVSAVPYTVGEFLAPVQAPATFPAGISSRTSVRLVREYGRSEISLGATTVVLTEAGIFSNGDPADNWNTAARPTSMANAANDAPFFYKTFEPLAKTPDTTIRLTWELRVV